MVKKLFSKKGQLTILDLVMAPIAAVVLSILAVAFLQNATASVITTVNQEPASIACNFALDSLYGQFYVTTEAALSTLSLYDSAQYQIAVSNQPSYLSASCGSSCTRSYTFLSNSLTNFTSLYSDFIEYFSSFSFNQFDSIKNSNKVTLSTLGMNVYLNQVPASINGSTICSLQVYNPEDPSTPYTIFGVLS